MDRIINVKVGGNYLSKDNKNGGVRGEGNVTYLRITFDEGWEGYAKTVTFLDAHGNNPVKRVQGVDLIEDIINDTKIYITPIPPEPLAIAGEMTFIIDGYSVGKRQRSISSKLEVKDAPDTDNAAEATDPTPTQAEQLQKQIDGIITDIRDAVIAKSAAEMAQAAAEASRDAASVSASSAETSADMANTSAEEAQISAMRAIEAIGKSSYIGENGNWYAWDTKTSGYYDTGVKAQAGSTVYVGDNPPENATVWVYTDGEIDDVPPHKHSAADVELDNGENLASMAENMKGKADKEEIPSKVSQLENDRRYLTEHQDISGKADKPIITSDISTAYIFEFSNTYNNEVRLSEVSSISFTFGNGEYKQDYISGLSFDSGAIPTAIDYTDSGILNWVGTDCTNVNGLSIFQPSANTHYDIVFYFNGTQFIGLVNGFIPSTGNVVSV